MTRLLNLTRPLVRKARPALPLGLALMVALAGLGWSVNSAFASSSADAPAARASLSKDCGIDTSTSSTSDGVTFTYGSDVTQTMQTNVMDAITYARDYGQRTLKVKVNKLDICAFSTADELAQSEAAWLSRPEIYEGRLTFWRTSSAVGVARAFATTTTSGRTTNYGFFTFMASPDWARSASSQQVVAHEYFHLVQAQLSDLARDEGPIWLWEGSAELFGDLATAEKVGIDFERVRTATQRAVKGYTGVLKDLEDQSVFGSAANYRYSYPLAMLAADALSPGEDMSPFVAYFKELGKGVPWKDAFIHAFGTSIEAFYDSFTPNGQ